jgi:Kef-type K+ transport system membrane component KefB
MIHSPRHDRPWLHWLVYLGMIAGTVAVFLAVRHFGNDLQPASIEAVSSTTVVAKSAASHHLFFHLLLALVAVIAMGRVLSAVCRRLGQPPVIGEVIAGIVLGPSILGKLSPEAMDYLLPQGITPLLSVIAQLGIIMYMFLVGLHLNLGHVKNHAKSAIAISHAGITFPFALGAVLALWLYPQLSSQSVPFTNFSLFMGVALAVTAFPVLARILTDRKMEKTDIGVIALSCAAADDLTAWCLLALVVGIAQSQVDQALMVIAAAMVFIGSMFYIVKPLLEKLVRRYDNRCHSPEALTIVFGAVLLSSLITERIGIHAILGAFLLGAIFPHDSSIAREIHRKLYDVATLLFLPAFFALSGLRTEIGLLSTSTEWLICGAIIAVSTLGKIGGTWVAGRLTGMNNRDAGALGILMNTRGLMGLIVLNIGLDLGVISPKLFAMMVVMALVTTMMTVPLLTFFNLIPKRQPAPTNVPPIASSNPLAVT